MHHSLEFRWVVAVGNARLIIGGDVRPHGAAAPGAATTVSRIRKADNVSAHSATSSRRRRPTAGSRRRTSLSSSSDTELTDRWPCAPTPCHDGHLSRGMPIIDKATGRVVAVIVLLIAVAASLQGYLPGVNRAEQQRPPDSGASLVYVAALLSVSLVIVATALIARLRDPRRLPTSAGPLSDRFSGGRGRPRWRVLIVGAAVLMVWLLLLWLRSRFFLPQGMGAPQSAPQSGVPTPVDSATRQPAPRETGADRDVLRFLMVGTVALLGMLVVGAVVHARRRGVDQPRYQPEHIPGVPVPEAAAPALVRAAESGLAEIEDPNHEPRQAIIACYAAMEGELSRFPGAIPQDYDTPTEVLARAVEHRALHIDTAVELVNLFTEARFSPHLMDESHRSTALRVLRLVLAELRSSA